jgi:hypothetical protein
MVVELLLLVDLELVVAGEPLRDPLEQSDKASEVVTELVLMNRLVVVDLVE